MTNHNFGPDDARYTAMLVNAERNISSVEHAIGQQMIADVETSLQVEAAAVSNQADVMSILAEIYANHSNGVENEVRSPEYHSEGHALGLRFMDHYTRRLVSRQQPPRDPGENPNDPRYQ